MAHVFEQLVTTILQKSPLQKRNVEAFLGAVDETFAVRAERFAVNFPAAMEFCGIDLDQLPIGYAELCKDMLIEQMRFQKTGKYTLSQASEALETVYHSEEKMTRYMVGLAASQFLWPNHYGLFNFFLRMTASQKPGTYLEIGPGHGLFLAEAMLLLPDVSATAIDLSPTSAEMSRAVLKAYGVSDRCEVVVGDANDLPTGSYDYVVMCEVLEHVDNPMELMRSIGKLMSEDGSLFITTCSNCPAIDHVYLYTSADHIRAEIRQAGFDIVDEIALDIDNLPKMANGEKITGCNYAALLKKSEV